MKILFAPYNVASFSSILSTSLNKIPNVKAKGISLANNKYWAFSNEWIVIEFTVWKKNPVKRFFQELYAQSKLIQLIFGADVIHWQWDIKGQTIFNLHYHLIRLLKKPVIVEWLGSELRVPEIVFPFNPYYKRLWESGEYDYYYEGREISLERQKRFKKLNALPAVCPEMSMYLDKTIFHQYYLLNPRVNLSEFKPAFPGIGSAPPVIVHTPSVKKSKGTLFVRKAIEDLQKKGIELEYQEIHNVSKQQALNAIREADIFLDQFITGNYGMAACEAMAMGKPVVCYLMEPVKKLLPEDCPIINVNGDNLTTRLEELIMNKETLRTIGMKSRQYVEKFHNADKIAVEILSLYNNLLSKSEKINQAVSL